MKNKCFLVCLVLTTLLISYGLAAAEADITFEFKKIDDFGQVYETIELNSTEDHVIEVGTPFYYSIRAVVRGDHCNYVEFDFDNEATRTEMTPPYSLFGDKKNEYYAEEVEADGQKHELTVRAYDSDGKIAEETISFTMKSGSDDTDDTDDNDGRNNADNDLRAGTYKSSFNRSNDLISLHYDHSPDADDGHSAAADLSILKYKGIGRNSYIAVSGTHSKNSSKRFSYLKYDANSIHVMNSVFGSRWINARWRRSDSDKGYGWGGSGNPAVKTVANKWLETIKNGGEVWVKEGGPSDFTWAVINYLEDIKHVSQSKLDQVLHVVQHGTGNETSTDANIKTLKKHCVYSKIENGNDYNQTADLRITKNTTNIKAFIDSTEESNDEDIRKAWKAAFVYYWPLKGTIPSYYNAPELRTSFPGHALDFSDTVELLRIFNIGKDEVSNVAAFRKKILD